MNYPEAKEKKSTSKIVHELDSLFKPKSIAIIGASSKELSIGNVILKNLVHFGYTGKIYPINPKEPEVRGIKAYPTIFDVPDNIDLAHVIIPSKFVPQIIEDCGKKGIKSVIINSAGFSEMGEEGKALQKAFLAKAKEYGVRIFGPNCQGIINCDPEYNAYCDFTFTFPKPGSISIVALSGGVGAFIMQSLFDLEIGMRMYASNGNACDISISDVVNYYGEDEGTKAIILYTEGFHNPKEFLEVAKVVAKKKPILAMKAGRTEAGAQAAASHTGSLAGVDIATELIFEKAGILAFNNEEEMCQVAMAFSTQPIPKGNRVGIITNTGGPAVIATDELVSAGLVLPPLSDKAKNILKTTLLPEATIGNPIDVVATGGGTHFRSALDVLMNEETIDSIYINFVTAPFTDTDEVARQIVEVNKMKKKPIVCNFMTNLSMERYQVTTKIMKEGGVPCYAFPTTAAKALGALYKYHKVRSRNIGEAKVFKEVDKEKAKKIIQSGSSPSGRSGWVFLSSDKVYTLLSAYGIPVADWRLVDDVEKTVKAATEIGFPVVIKADAESLVHKSDLGGVAVNIKNADEVRAVVENMKRKFGPSSGSSPSGRSGGVADLKFFVQKFLPGGKELVAGVSAQRGLEPLVMFGLGGIYVEVLKDVVFKIAPVTELEAKEMLSSIKASKLLDGVRGEKGIHKESVIEIIQRLSQLVIDFPEIQEMDLNPIMAFVDKAFVVDARIKVQ
ncbi:MAG: acetate--CoA ligase family protein [Bacteroidetes bacterium]|nr:acetate--CoA ligase family protein [Bacteroidota bacterium]